MAKTTDANAGRRRGCDPHAGNSPEFPVLPFIHLSLGTIAARRRRGTSRICSREFGALGVACDASGTRVRPVKRGLGALNRCATMIGDCSICCCDAVCRGASCSCTRTIGARSRCCRRRARRGASRRWRASTPSRATSSPDGSGWTDMLRASARPGASRGFGHSLRGGGRMRSPRGCRRSIPSAGRSPVWRTSRRS